MRKQTRTSVTFDQPVKYRIEISGCLDYHWRKRMADFGLTAESHKGRTTLVGRLRDQSQLCGVLNMLPKSGVVLLSVSLLNSE
jgi:hypothetical protein